MKKLLKSLIPPRIRAVIRGVILNIPDGFAAKSYSQEGEDMILRRIFGYLESGFYVDIGALHPRRFSNTYYFYRKGWRGINIDATPGSMKLFNEMRWKDINLEIAVANEKREMTYHIFNEPAVNTFDKKFADKAIDDGYELIRKQKIETKTLKEIFVEYLPKNKKIDFMSVDVEGFELEVLKSNDFDLFRPAYILVECHDININEIQNNDIYNFLRGKSYDFFGKTVLTLIFKENYT
jgi:FkbM family methyltransferase